MLSNERYVIYSYESTTREEILKAFRKLLVVLKSRIVSKSQTLA